MKLLSFSVENYRSIRKAPKLPIGQLTVLLGPNNEGKSNILRALTTSLKVLSSLEDAFVVSGKSGPAILTLGGDTGYQWRRDFPVSLQSTSPNGQSSFDLDFELDSTEIQAFLTEVKSHLSGTLPVRIAIGKDAGSPNFRVIKRGPGSHTLSKKADAIARFIGKRLQFGYVPAIRTAEEARDVVEDMVDNELALLERDPTYASALSAIASIQEPVLKRIAESIRETLRVFIPSIQDVQLRVLEKKRVRALRRAIEIIVDDGTPTNLVLKGDGVQSLAALGMLRQASERGAGGRNLVLAIEEPESHLHPKAIHQLKQVLQEIAAKHQVIITTHCPIFVDRRELPSNIVVTSNKAAPARNIRQLRDVLGVRASDNLRNAELVLLVEGEDDEQALKALLEAASSKISLCLQNGTLAIDSMLGALHLAYKVSQLRDTLCDVQVFLDHDQAAREAVRRAETDGLITSAEITYATCLDMPESEIEDMYDEAVYTEMLKQTYNVVLTGIRPLGSRRKWTQRMRGLFSRQGQAWDDRIAREVKQKIADCVLSSPGQALNAHRRGPFDTLVRVLEEKLTTSPTTRRRAPSVPDLVENK